MHDDDPIPPRPKPRLVGKSEQAKRGERKVRAPRSRRATLIVWLVVFAVLFIVGPASARRFADFLWYREIGFERVFLTKVVAQWIFGLTTGLVAFAILFFNARAALRNLDVPPLGSIDKENWTRETRVAFLTRFVQVLATPATVLFAFLLALGGASQWRTIAQFFYRQPFGVTDPIFGRDVGYYVFTVPAIEAVLDSVGAAIMLSFFLIGIPIYLARGEIGLRGLKLRVDPLAQVHLAVLAALLLIVAGVRTFLVAIPSLLLITHAPLTGASYTDLTIRLPMLRILGALALVAGIPVVWGAWRGRLVRTASATLGGFAILAILLNGVVPALFQRLAVQPNELTRETPQIRHHIAATRRAWGLDSIERRDLTAAGGLTRRDIEANQTTITNVRLWDREPLLQTFGQIQSIRTYYDFVTVDDDRYRIDGQLRQVLLSARELSATSLPIRTFINEHLTFTHGMGLTLGPSNQVTPEGLPVLWIKDLPPVSSVPIRVTRPQIYFGELQNDFVLAPTRQKEFDFPAGEGDAAAYTTYAGTAGVPVGSLAQRLLFAFRFRSMNLVLSRDLTADTRILYHRNILERAQLALPFLRFDRDPYLVVTDSGQLEWILDAYTTTDRYPYAYRLADGTNYMRNSVKVVIDAYDGDIRAYVADPGDPILRTLSRIYPGLLRPIAEMPADLRAHVRYPEDLFLAQTALYATFHMNEVEAFYHREDQWQVPVTPEGGDGFMRHIVMRLPGERDPEFILMRPFTPRQKDNLAAWMVARNDGDQYGKLIVYRFTQQSLVFGPTQIVNRINQDTDVAQQISLWDQRGSEVIRGELLVIPIEQSLIYVQPLYLRAEGGRIPELKRVIVAHEGQVAMEGTLEAGLRRLFGDSTALGSGTRGDTTRTTTVTEDSASVSEAQLLEQAVQHYERARAAQRADDWTTYGNEMRRLGEVLRRLRRN